MKRLAITVALVATLAIAAPVSAAVTTITGGPGCGQVTVYNGVPGRGVRLYSSTFSHAAYHFVFSHDGTSTFSVAVGGYSYQFHNRSGQTRANGQLVVGC